MILYFIFLHQENLVSNVTDVNLTWNLIIVMMGARENKAWCSRWCPAILERGVARACPMVPMPMLWQSVALKELTQVSDESKIASEAREKIVSRVWYFFNLNVHKASIEKIIDNFATPRDEISLQNLLETYIYVIWGRPLYSTYSSIVFWSIKIVVS